VPLRVAASGSRETRRDHGRLGGRPEDVKFFGERGEVLVAGGEGGFAGGGQGAAKQSA